VAVTEWLAPTVIALIASTLVTALSIVVRARVELRKSQADMAKAPAEVQSIIAGGSEAAVTALTTALHEQGERIQHLEAESAEKDRRIEQLEQDLTRAHVRIGRMQGELDRLRPPIP
jgi:uncharacterized coiled-coil protein SlyX